MFNNQLTHTKKHRLLAIVTASILILSFSAVTFAVRYPNMDTNDSSIDEWEANGILIYQEDEVGEVSDANADIEKVWVATGDDDHLYFRMKMKGNAPLSTVRTSAVARLDCGKDGKVDQRDDRIVAYMLDGGSERVGRLPSDTVTVLTGDQWYYFYPDNPDKLGQVVGQYVEWAVPISELGPNPQEDFPGDCRNGIRISFATSQSQLGGGLATIIDETPLPTDVYYDVPTAVSVSKFNAASLFGKPTALLTVVCLFIFGTVAGFAKLRRRAK